MHKAEMRDRCVEYITGLLSSRAFWVKNGGEDDIIKTRTYSSSDWVREYDTQVKGAIGLAQALGIEVKIGKATISGKIAVGELPRVEYPTGRPTL